MALSNSTNSDALFLADKLPWEDPALTLERQLLARAQYDGPPDNDDNWTPRQLLGPLNVSGGVC